MEAHPCPFRLEGAYTDRFKLPDLAGLERHVSKPSPPREYEDSSHRAFVQVA